MLALGLNIVVGFAGLLDLGYIAFYAVGAYIVRAAGLAAPDRAFPVRSRSCSRTACTCRSGSSCRSAHRAGGRVRRAARRADAEAARRLPRHRHARLRRDHPHLHQQPERPVNITNGPQGITLIDPMRIGPLSLEQPRHGARHAVLVADAVLLPVRAARRWSAILVVRAPAGFAHRPGLDGDPRGRDRRARPWASTPATSSCWRFAWARPSAASSGAMFAAFQGFVSPESFSLMESIMVLSMVVLGGMGHMPGVILGAVLLARAAGGAAPYRRAAAGGAVRAGADRRRGAAHAAVRPGAWWP